jgi:hypothetical protein
VLLDKKSVTLTPGKSTTITASTKPSGINGNFDWSVAGTYDKSEVSITTSGTYREKCTIKVNKNSKLKAILTIRTQIENINIVSEPCLVIINENSVYF